MFLYDMYTLRKLAREVKLAEEEEEDKEEEKDSATPRPITPVSPHVRSLGPRRQSGKILTVE
jgi:hypothetical protein